jgi:hypothetical protein
MQLNPSDFALVVAVLISFAGQSLRGADQLTDPPVAANSQSREFTPPQGLARFAKDADIWIDVKGKRVVIDGRVSLRSGALEMFACPRGTKEHESVVAVNSKAINVHAGLLAIGAKAGHPVKFDPDYSPATGTVIHVEVQWKDEEGEIRKVRAQEWIKNTKTQKQAESEWVFAGSGIWKDPVSGEQYYHGDGGDFICVSNFPTATLDLTIPSSQANDALLFEAFTGRIPPAGTPVRIVLRPKLEPKADRPPAEKSAEKSE